MKRLLFLLPLLVFLTSCIRSLDEEGIGLECHLEGRVLERASQQAVAGLYVQLLVDGEGMSTTLSGSDGRFSFTASAKQLSHGVVLEVLADSLYEGSSRRFEPEGYGRVRYDVGVLYVVGPTLPIVHTLSIGTPAATEVECCGRVEDDGRSAVVSRGFVFSTMQYPTVDDGRVGVGAGIGEFCDTISNLQPATTYYLRAYATNGVGTAYGEQQQFATIGGAPVVSTSAVGGITATTATCGGTVVSDAGFAVTARGVCWSTLPEPTIVNAHTTSGSGTGTFVSSISGLSPCTTYYLRAYATNSIGTAYGEERVFTTSSGLPTVLTGTTGSVGSTSAICNGEVLGDGGFGVTERGTCYSTTPNPTAAGPHTTDGSGIGQFTSYLVNLSPNTTYHYRAYATNASGTVYGEEQTFVTNGQ